MSSRMAQAPPEPTEWERVQDWRLSTLLDAGCTTTAAEKLAFASHVDLHEAVALLKAGCSPTLALEILL